MIYFKGVLIGIGTVLLGCLVAPIAWMIWAIRKSQDGAATISYSPMGLGSHLAHSLGFWVFIIALFAAGFVPSVFFPKR
jgi:hypothetical protein